MCFQHPVDIVDVKSVRLADSGAFVALDDEVADVLEDMEMVSWKVVGRGLYLWGEMDGLQVLERVGGATLQPLLCCRLARGTVSTNTCVLMVTNAAAGGSVQGVV